jgi:hypothetical protein
MNQFPHNFKPREDSSVLSLGWDWEYNWQSEWLYGTIPWILMHFSGDIHPDKGNEVAGLTKLKQTPPAILVFVTWLILYRPDPNHTLNL